MSIWNKILVGLIIVVGLAFLYLSMRTLKAHQYWRSLAQNYDKRIDDVKKENEELKHGADVAGQEAKLGIDQYRVLLDKLLVDRGRVWANCEPKGPPNPQTGQVAVVVDVGGGAAHGIGEKAVLYAFEEKEANQEKGGGKYLGEFEVEGVAENQIQLKPTMKMEPRQLQQLANASKPWVLYEKMPVDSRDVFADLSEADKKKLLPARVVAEYVHDGEKASAEKLEQWGVEGVLVDDKGKLLVDDQGNRLPNVTGTYQRPLRDYLAALKLRHKQRVELHDLIESSQRDLQYMKSAASEAEKQVEDSKQLVAQLKDELGKTRRERDAVVAHFNAVKAKAEQIENEIKQLLAANKTMTGQIVRAQLDAARRIDQRSRAMAQSGEAPTSN